MLKEKPSNWWRSTAVPIILAASAIPLLNACERNDNSTQYRISPSTKIVVRPPQTPENPTYCDSVEIVQEIYRESSKNVDGTNTKYTIPRPLRLYNNINPIDDKRDSFSSGIQFLHRDEITVWAENEYGKVPNTEKHIQIRCIQEPPQDFSFEIHSIANRPLGNLPCESLSVIDRVYLPDSPKTQRWQSTVSFSPKDALFSRLTGFPSYNRDDFKTLYRVNKPAEVKIHYENTSGNRRLKDYTFKLKCDK